MFLLRATFPLLAACLLALSPAPLSAHGINFLKEAVNGYLVDVGYNVIIITPGSPVVFDFLLWDEEETQTKEVSNVWARIEDRNGRSHLNVNVGQPVFGRLALLYAFPSAGAYTLEVRYERDGEVLAEASFPLTVEASGGSAGTGDSSDFFVGGIFGLLAGGALAYFVLRRR
jgi:hypothetical protein